MTPTGDRHMKIARDHSLDAFRAIFILAVMVYHYLVRWTPPAAPRDLYGYAYTYDTLFEIGMFGVHAFFLISGLFITVTLVRSGDAITFMYKRVLRIYPAFLVAATFTFLVLLVAGPPEFRVGLRDYVLTLTLFAGNLGGRYVDGAYWSLAVEMKFYFWVAVAYQFLRGRFWMGLIGLEIAGALLGLIQPKIAKEILLAPYLPFFLAGIGLAYRSRLGDPRTATILFVAAALGYAWHWGFVALGDGRVLLPNLALLAAIGTIFLFALSPLRINWAPLTYLGLISYEVYLVHQYLGVMVIGAARRILGLPDAAAFLLACLTAVALAAFLHHVAQRPIQALFGLAWQRFRGNPPPRPPVE